MFHVPPRPAANANRLANKMAETTMRLFFIPFFSLSVPLDQPRLEARRDSRYWPNPKIPSPRMAKPQVETAGTEVVGGVTGVTGVTPPLVRLNQIYLLFTTAEMPAWMDPWRT